MERKQCWVKAHHTAEHGDSPLFARFTITPAFVARVSLIAGLISAHNLTEARFSGAPDSWGPDDAAQFSGFLDLQCPEVVVTAREFWFVDYHEADDGQIETIPIAVTQLCEALETDGDYQLYCGDDPAAFAQLIRDMGDPVFPG